MEEQDSGRRTGIAGLALGVLMVACCMALPLIAAGVGALTLGAVLGIGAGVLALLATCAYVGYRMTAGKRC